MKTHNALVRSLVLALSLVGLLALLAPSTALACGPYGDPMTMVQWEVDWAKENLTHAIEQGDAEQIEIEAERLANALESLKALELEQAEAETAEVVAASTLRQ